MAAIQKLTLAKMRLLHAALVEFGPLCVSEAADVAGLHKGSSQDWMSRLARLGCVYELPTTSPICTKTNARYFGVTDVPFPDGQLINAGKAPAGGAGFEFSRQIVKAVNMGLKRDPLIAAFFGEKA